MAWISRKIHGFWNNHDTHLAISVSVVLLSANYPSHFMSRPAITSSAITWISVTMVTIATLEQSPDHLSVRRHYCLLIRLKLYHYCKSFSIISIIMTRALSSVSFSASVLLSCVIFIAAFSPEFDISIDLLSIYHFLLFIGFVLLVL